MHEHDPSGQSPHQQLIDLLTADFRPSPSEPESPINEDNALARFLAHTVSAEEVDERFHSLESIDLGEQSEILLRPAQITIAFKMFITERIRHAYAHQTKVDEAISPERLGIATGEGIFDAGQAKDIEAQILRGHAFDVIKRYLIAPENAEEHGLPPQVLRPGIRPSDASNAISLLHFWTQDFQATYGEDPFEGTREAYQDVSIKAQVIDVEGEGDETGWGDFIERLNQLRQQREQE